VSLADPETSAALSLLSAKAVREHAHRMLAIGLDDRLPNFRIQLDRLDSAVDLVLATIHVERDHVTSELANALGAGLS